MSTTCLYIGEDIAAYGFPGGHPFGPDRHDAFLRETRRRGLLEQVEARPPLQASREQIELFHTPEYVSRVIALSRAGRGLIDYGDTPAFPGVYEASAFVVGAALAGLRSVMAGECRYSFQPIGGLHHARRERAAGFCVFNDCAVVIEALRAQYGIRRVAYVDIDVHHGDGVFYPFEADPDVVFVDLHEDGRYLYPGTGFAEETGKGDAAGSKLNIPMPPGADDDDFIREWQRVERFLRSHRPEFILFQCGADSVGGDPLAHLNYTPEAHRFAARRLRMIAEELCGGRLMAFGGGGYNRANLAAAWNNVLEAFVEPAPEPAQ